MKLRAILCIAALLISAFAACGGCSHQGIASNIATEVDYTATAPHKFNVNEEVHFNDAAFDEFLGKLLQHDKNMAPEEQHTSRMIRMGILMGTMMYFFMRQNVDDQSVIMSIAKTHLEATRRYYAEQDAKRRAARGEIDGDDNAPPTPPIEPQSHVTPSTPSIPTSPARPMHIPQHNEL